MDDAAEGPPISASAVERAFGAANRRRLLAEYFDGLTVPVTTANAWQHVYRLLLWINPTISLAHCYESDKCQPHKPWYPRSLAFHAWLASELGVAPGDVHDEIDQLFRSALPALSHVEAEARRQAALKHLSPYGGIGMPLPGDDPDLIEIIVDTLGPDLEPDALDVGRARLLVERIYGHFAQENKRKNLLGRGFEDALAAIIGRLPGHEQWEVHTRAPLKQIPGFTSHGAALERVEIDLALWQPHVGGRRVLVSAKWSVRADRERQFGSDFGDYIRANSAGLFEYVLITNEFDAARLHAACTNVHGNQYLFTHVVHVEPRGVLTAYGKDAEIRATAGGAPGAGGRKARFLNGHRQTGRLIDLCSWLDDVLQ